MFKPEIPEPPEVVCAGWCNRRGPQVRLVNSVRDVTCRACLDLIEGD